jgi:hypothetical protein
MEAEKTCKLFDAPLLLKLSSCKLFELEIPPKPAHNHRSLGRSTRKEGEGATDGENSAVR